MEEKTVQEKSFRFALKIIEVYQKMIIQKEYIISKQLFRSGTSIGANVAEAQGGISKREFRNKMSISLKEALETRYWFNLLDESKFVRIDLKSEMEELEEIINMLFKIVKTTTENLSIKSYTLKDSPVLGID